MVAWWLADYYGGVKYSARFFYYWNNAVHLISFVINAVTIAKIKSELDRRQRLVNELETTREALQIAAAMLRSCPACGKPHDRAEPDVHENSRRAASIHPELAKSLCADCRDADGNANTAVITDLRE